MLGAYPPSVGVGRSLLVVADRVVERVDVDVAAGAVAVLHPACLARFVDVALDVVAIVGVVFELDDEVGGTRADDAVGSGEVHVDLAVPPVRVHREDVPGGEGLGGVDPLVLLGGGRAVDGVLHRLPVAVGDVGDVVEADLGVRVVGGDGRVPGGRRHDPDLRGHVAGLGGTGIGLGVLVVGAAGVRAAGGGGVVGRGVDGIGLLVVGTGGAAGAPGVGRAGGRRGVGGLVFDVVAGDEGGKGDEVHVCSRERGTAIA